MNKCQLICHGFYSSEMCDRISIQIVELSWLPLVQVTCCAPASRCWSNLSLGLQGCLCHKMTGERYSIWYKSLTKFIGWWKIAKWSQNRRRKHWQAASKQQNNNNKTLRSHKMGAISWLLHRYARYLRKKIWHSYGILASSAPIYKSLGSKGWTRSV